MMNEFTLFKITLTINLPLGETDNNMCQVCQLFRSVGRSSNVMYQYDFKIRKFYRDANGSERRFLYVHFVALFYIKLRI